MDYNFIHNTKASEIYIDVTFDFGDIKKNWYIPIKNRRDGTNLEDASEKEIKNYLENVKKYCDPKNWKNWKDTQKEFWKKKPKSKVTKPIFDMLIEDFSWMPVESFNNPNYARRIQELKEFGYTVISGVKKYNKQFNKKTVHVLLIPLPRGGINGYEQWDKATRNRIIDTLEIYDAYEGKKSKPHGLLPDHKFPEIRWDKNTKRTSSEISKLKPNEIKRDFQLMSNQRNLQKREVCRNCYQTNQRGKIFGIDYYYFGDGVWDSKIAKTGKKAEKGCIGCGWYDIELWRKNLSEELQ